MAHRPGSLGSPGPFLWGSSWNCRLTPGNTFDGSTLHCITQDGNDRFERVSYIGKDPSTISVFLYTQNVEDAERFQRRRDGNLLIAIAINYEPLVPNVDSQLSLVTHSRFSSPAKIARARRIELSPSVEGLGVFVSTAFRFRSLPSQRTLGACMCYLLDIEKSA